MPKWGNAPHDELRNDWCPRFYPKVARDMGVTCMVVVTEARGLRAADTSSPSEMVVHDFFCGRPTSGDIRGEFGRPK